MANINDSILQKQLAQRLGRYSETVELDAKEGESKIEFPQVSAKLNKATIVGVEVCAGTNGMKSTKTGKVLMSKAEISSGRLHLEDCNRNVLDFPLRFFITDGKPFLYVAIDPIIAFNPSQCYVYFAANFDSSTAAKALEINFITE